MQGDASSTEPQCLICLDPLFDHPVCALGCCGHCYHGSCFQEWLGRGKSECPQCKKVTSSSDLRFLEVEIGEVENTSLEEVRKWMGLTPAQRAELRQDLAEKSQEVTGQLDKAVADFEELQGLVSERKKRRRELEKELPEKERAVEELEADLARVQESQVQLQLHVEEEDHKQRAALPIRPCRANDPELKTEHRRLKSLRTEDRLKQLHEALTQALEQEHEALVEARERIAATQLLEAELDEQQRKLDKLKEGSRFRTPPQAMPASSMQAAQRAAQSTAMTAALQGAALIAKAGGAGADAVHVQAPDSEATPSAIAAASLLAAAGAPRTGGAATKSTATTVLQYEASDDALYSRPLMRKKTSHQLGALLSASSASKHSMAALLGGGKASAPARTSGSMRTLLSER